MVVTKHFTFIWRLCWFNQMSYLPMLHKIVLICWSHLQFSALLSIYLYNKTESFSCFPNKIVLQTFNILWLIFILIGYFFQSRHKPCTLVYFVLNGLFSAKHRYVPFLCNAYFRIPKLRSHMLEWGLRYDRIISTVSPKANPNFVFELKVKT